MLEIDSSYTLQRKVNAAYFAIEYRENQSKLVQMLVSLDSVKENANFNILFLRPLRGFKSKNSKLI